MSVEQSDNRMMDPQESEPEKLDKKTHATIN